MRSMFVILILGLLMIAGYGVYAIRTVPSDPAVWHVDPLTAPVSETPNSYRVAPEGLSDQPIDMVAPIYAIDAATLAAAFDAFVMGQPRVERLAGTVEEGWITYIQRTEQLRFPDYISVRFYDLEDSGLATLALYSRSRFGYSDMGVNAARVQSWLTSIQSFENE